MRKSYIFIQVICGNNNAYINIYILLDGPIKIDKQTN